jgi:hypothetical protein
MIKISILLLSHLLLTACTANTPYEKYVSQTNKVLKLVKDNQNIDKSEKVTNEIKTLIELGEKSLQIFIVKKPECKTFLELILSKKNEMINLPLEKIEHDYHAGYGLPQTEAECDEMKELLVHPITTLTILREKGANKKSFKYIKHELEEVLIHIHEFMDLLL